MSEQQKIQEILKRDKQRIRYYFYILFLATTILLLIRDDSYRITLYFGIYFFFGYLVFVFMEKWLTTLSLFYVFYSYALGFGVFFVWYEKRNLLFNPYIMVIGSFLLVLLGYVCGGKIRINKRKIQVRIALPTQFNMTEVLYVLYIISTMAFIIYLIKNASVLFADFNNGRITAMSGNGLLLYLLKVHVITVPCMYEEYKKKRMKLSVFIILLLFAIMQTLMTGFRTTAGIIFFVIIVFDILQGRLKLRLALIVAGILLGMLTVFGFVRGGNSFRSLYYVARGVFYNSLYNLNLIFATFPDKMDYQFGKAYLINLKVLLPGSNPDFTLWLKNAVRISFSGGGLTPTIMGEFYLNFGYVGIILGMFMLGILFAQIDKYVNMGKITYWKIYLMTYASMCVAGGLSGIYMNLLLNGIIYILLCLVSRENE